jgi:mannose-1-phosphate guanylyltransferase
MERLRALLLAAGLGTRLRPLTLDTPKCLVTVGGEPLLSLWLRNLEALGCESVIVNTHYLSEKVENFLDSWTSSAMSVKVVHEKQLLGTAGTLLKNKDFFRGTTGLLIHADNIMSDNLECFLDAHRKRPTNCDITMLTFTTQTPKLCGIVEINDQSIVTEFYEKHHNPPSARANGAIYAFSEYFLRDLALLKPLPADFSTEVVPAFLGRIYSWHTNAPYIDIGSPEALQKARQIWSLEQNL